MKKKYLLLSLLIPMSIMVSCVGNTSSISTSNSETTDTSSTSSNSTLSTVAVTEVKFTNPVKTMRVGDDPIPLTYQVLPENATDKSVTFSSSNTDVAYVEEGKLNAKAKGEATITIHAGDVSDSFTVNVKAPEVSMIVLTSQKEKIAVGEETKLNVNVVPTNAEYQKITYESETPTIATVSEDGLVKGVSAGSAKINAKISKEDGTVVTGSCTITVEVVSVTSVDITTTTQELAVGETLQLEYEVSPTNATNKKVSFSSSDDNSATVSENGLVTALKVSESVTITVKTEDQDKSDSISLKIVTSYDKYSSSLQEKINASEAQEKQYATKATFKKDSKSTYSTSSTTEVTTFYSDKHQIVEKEETTNSTTTKSKTYRGYDADDAAMTFYTIEYDVDNSKIKSSSASTSLSNEEKEKKIYLLNITATAYGLFGYANRVLTTDSLYWGDSYYYAKQSDKVITISENEATVVAKFETGATSPSYPVYYDISFSIEFNKDGGITSTNYVCKKYNASGYSVENHALVEDGQPYETKEESYTMEYGTRAKDTGNFNTKMLFFTSLEMSAYKDSDGNSEQTTFKTNESTIYFKVKNAEPNTASMNTDNIVVKSVDVTEGSMPNLTTSSFSTRYSSNYISLSNPKVVGKFTVTFESTKNKKESSVTVTIVPPDATSLDAYVNDSYTKSGSTVDLQVEETRKLSAKVYPQGAIQDYTIIANNEHVSLAKQDDGSYILTAVSEGLSEVTFASGSINTMIKFNVTPKTEKLTTESFKALLTSGNYIYYNKEKEEQTLVFNADGTGRADYESYGYFTFSWEVADTDDNYITLTLTATDYSNDKYYEATNNLYIQPVTIAKNSDGKKMQIHIEGMYSGYLTNYTYVWTEKA